MGLWFDLLSAAVVVVVASYAFPHYVFPAIARWREGRGHPLEPGTTRNLAPVLLAIVAVVAAAFVLDPDTGRRIAIPLAVAGAGVLLAMWQVSRR